MPSRLCGLTVTEILSKSFTKQRYIDSDLAERMLLVQRVGCWILYFFGFGATCHTRSRAGLPGEAYHPGRRHWPSTLQKCLMYD